MNRSAFRFHESLRVRWAEVDLQKIVFNGHYLMYFDTAVAGYWRALALPYQTAMVRLGGDLFVRKASVEYHASAEYDDVLDIGIRCDRVGQSSIRFVAAVFRNDDLLVSGELIYVFADPHLKVSRPVPEPLREAFTAYESGDAMVSYQTASTAANEAGAPSLEPSTRGFRTMGINRLGDTVSESRWACGIGEDGASCAQLNHMEVVPALRRSGLGWQALRTLEDEARRAGCARLRISAPSAWVAVLQSQGFGIAPSAGSGDTLGVQAMTKAL